MVRKVYPTNKRKRGNDHALASQHTRYALKRLGLEKAMFPGEFMVRKRRAMDGSRIKMVTIGGMDYVFTRGDRFLQEEQKIEPIIRGLFGIPVSNNSLSGWGKPFYNESDQRLYPGTPGGDNPGIFFDHADKGDYVPIRLVQSDEWDPLVISEMNETGKVMLIYGGIDWQSTNKDPRLRPLVRPLEYEPEQDPALGREVVLSFGWLGFGRYVVSWDPLKGGEYFIYFEGSVHSVTPRQEFNWTIVGVAWNEQRDTLICAMYNTNTSTLEFYERPWRPLGYGQQIFGNSGTDLDWQLMTGHNGVSLEQNVLFNSDGDRAASISNVGGTMMHTEWPVQGDGTVTLEDKSAGAFGDNRYVRVDKITHGSLQLDEYAGEKGKFDSTCELVPEESNWNDTCGTADRIEWWQGYIANKCSRTNFDCETHWFDTHAAALACNIANGGDASGVYAACGVQHFLFGSGLATDHQWWEEYTGSEMHTGEVGVSNPSVVVLCDWGNPREGEGNIQKNSDLVIRIEKFAKTGDYHNDFRVASMARNWTRTQKIPPGVAIRSTCSEQYEDYTWNVVDALRMDGDWGQTSCTVWFRDPDGNERPICNFGERTKNGREYKLRQIGSMDTGTSEIEDCAFHGFPLPPQSSPWSRRWDVNPPTPGYITYLWPTNWPFIDFSSWSEQGFKDQYEQIECGDGRLNTWGIRRVNHTPPGWADEGVLVSGSAKFLLTPDPWDFIDTSPGSYVSLGNVLEQEIDLMWTDPGPWEGGDATHHWMRFNLYRLWEAYAHVWRNTFGSAMDRWQNWLWAHQGHAYELHPETVPNVDHDTNVGDPLGQIQASGPNTTVRNVGVV